MTSLQNEINRRALPSLENGDSFIMVCLYKKGLIVESNFIVEINNLFTEIVTLQFYKADIILFRTNYQNSDCLNAVYSKKRSNHWLNHSNHTIKCCPLQLQQYKNTFYQSSSNGLSICYTSFFLSISGPILSPVNSLCLLWEPSQTGNWKKTHTRNWWNSVGNNMVIFVFLPMPRAVDHIASSSYYVLFQHQTPCLLSDSNRTPDTELKKPTNR